MTVFYAFTSRQGNVCVRWVQCWLKGYFYKSAVKDLRVASIKQMMIKSHLRGACSFCLNTVEDVNHLFIHSPFSSSVSTLKLFDVQWSMPHSIVQLSHAWVIAKGSYWFSSLELLALLLLIGAYSVSTIIGCFVIRWKARKSLVIGSSPSNAWVHWLLVTFVFSAVVLSHLGWWAYGSWVSFYLFIYPF